MPIEKPRITAKIAGRALHPLLRPFAIGYFLAALACDLVYSQASLFAQQGAPEFASITEWLLGVGLVMAGLVFSGEKRLDKAGQSIAPDAALEVRGVGSVFLRCLSTLPGTPSAEARSEFRLIDISDRPNGEWTMRRATRNSTNSVVRL